MAYYTLLDKTDLIEMVERVSSERLPVEKNSTVDK